MLFCSKRWSSSINNHFKYYTNILNAYHTEKWAKVLFCVLAHWYRHLSIFFLLFKKKKHPTQAKIHASIDEKVYSCRFRTSITAHWFTLIDIEDILIVFVTLLHPLLFHLRNVFIRKRWCLLKMIHRIG